MKKLRNIASHSLYLELWLSLILALIVGALFYILLQQVNYVFMESDWVTNTYIPNKIDDSVNALQDYIDDNNISSDNPKAIYDWSTNHPLIYFYILKDDRIIYNFYADYSEDTDKEIASYNQELIDDYLEYNTYGTVYNLNFSDGPSQIYIFEEFQYALFTKIQYAILVLSAFLIICIITVLVRKKIHYINQVTHGISILEGGDFTYNIPVKGDDEISSLAASLNSMRIALSQQMENEKKALSANNSLVTALSHDLRTPLTTQMGYLEILKEHHYSSSEEMDKYISTALDTCNQIKEMSDRLFEYFLAFDPNPKRPDEALEEYDGMAFIMQLISELTPPLTDQGFTFDIDTLDEEFSIKVNADDVLRIFNNVFTNIDKYADETYPVSINIKKEEGYAYLSFTNKIRNIPRKNESAKIGLISISSLMKRQGGSSVTRTSKSDFTIELKFPISN
ncbi:MAG: HAMP domain-containing histidine kinase [Pseudobutyrivibrio sp.]|nr:HAMP domain-containing histidine kinase [Pseudobutyrivibrio sp.]